MSGGGALGQRPKVVAMWKGKEYYEPLDILGDLTFIYPDNAGRCVSRILMQAFSDEILKQMKEAGYDITTLRLTIKKTT